MYKLHVSVASPDFWNRPSGLDVGLRAIEVSQPPSGYCRNENGHWNENANPYPGMSLLRAGQSPTKSTRQMRRPVQSGCCLTLGARCRADFEKSV
jgi:hypothetical protein